MQQTEILKKVFDDFKKSGISKDVINQYIEYGCLTASNNYWQLNYPELIGDSISDYYTRRIYNNENYKYIKPKGQCSRLFRPLDLAIIAYINPNEYIIITEGEKKAKVRVITLPQCYPKLGLDDFLVKYGKSEFQKLMNNAELLSIKTIQNILSENKPEIIYPLEIFSEKLKEFFIDLQKRQDAPIEYLTSSFIAGASVLMDGKYAILVDKSKNWIDHPILWTAIVGNASQKKSPCLDYIKTRNLKSISPTQLYKSNTSKYKSKSDAQIVLENLSSKDFGRLTKSKNGGANFIVYL